MFNSNSHQISDMAHMHREELIRYADEERLRRLTMPRGSAPWSTLRTNVGDWLIATGEQLKPAPPSMVGRQAPQS